MSKRLAHIEAAKEECLRLGATIEVEQHTKHYIGVIYYNGKVRKTSFSGTTHDTNMPRIVRGQIRRMIREMEGV